MTTSVNNSAVNTVVVSTIKAFDFGRIKQSFKSGKACFTKITKLQDKMKALEAEIAAEQVKLNAINSYCELITNGYTPQDLVTEITETSDKLDKNGNPVTIYKYEPKEGTLRFNDEKKVYEIISQEVALNQENTEQNPPIVDAEAEVEMVKVEKAFDVETVAEDAFGESKDYKDSTAIDWNNL